MANYFDGKDAVFLPGKIHGAEQQVYIIYYNSDANNGNGCFEIEILDAEKTIELYEYVNGYTEKFFALLPDWFQGEWYYCDSGTDLFDSYTHIYNEADFITGRDGDRNQELLFLMNTVKKLPSHDRS